MSDSEDDSHMEIDQPNGSSKLFDGAPEAKGKRSAANLPIAALDSLPWVEKYRPDSLSDVAGHHDILATIDRFISSNRLPHLLFYGPPGTGKTSTILALARKIYGQENMRRMVLELNASDDRGIDVVREQIKTFASTKQIYVKASSEDQGLANFKLIILDEADAMTNAAQMALRRIMEKYTTHTRFCVIANYSHKLSPALLSRCTRFRFSPLKEDDIRLKVEQVIENEKIDITRPAVDSLVRLSKGDMRRALNVLQACFASSAPLPPAKGEHSQINETAIYDCVAAPHPDDIHKIIETLLHKSDVTSCLTTLNQLKTNKGLALADILTAVSEELTKLEVKPQTRVLWLDGMSEIEWRLGGGGSEAMQTGALVGIVRKGVELTPEL